MYLLDTNHCSRIIDGDRNVIQTLDNLGNITVLTCAIVRGELIYMAHKSERHADNLRLVVAKQYEFVIVSADSDFPENEGSIRS